MKRILFLLWLALSLFLIPTARAEINPELKQQILTTTDESFLMEILKRPGDSDDDVFMKNLVVKRLMTVGTEAAVPVLLDLLQDERQSYNARFALEALESDKINPALEKAVTEMSGRTAVDLVASLGARRDAAAVPNLKTLLESADSTPEMKRGVLTALGFIASPEADAILKEEANQATHLDVATLRVLGNALVFAGMLAERDGDSSTAISLYQAASDGAFPANIRFTAELHALAAAGNDSVSTIIEKLASENSTDREIALTVIPLLSASAGEPLVREIKNVFDSLDPMIKPAVLTALAARKDDASRKVFLPWLKEKALGADKEISLAAIRIYGRMDYNASPEGMDGALALADDLYARANTDLLSEMTKRWFRLNRPELDAWTLTRLADFNNLSVPQATSLLDWIKWRRTPGADSLLTEWLAKENLDPQVRDAAYVALAETVPLERLTSFIELTAGLGGDVPQILLNRACSRLPREESALEVISLFDRSDASARQNFIEVLRQIGGNAAVDRVANAALDKETVDAATKALGEWDKQADMERVADACLKLSKELKSEKYRIRVVKGFIRAPRQFNLPAEKRIEMANTAFKLEGRSEDRALVFDIFERIIDVRSVVAAMNYAENDTFREKACETAVKVAEKIKLDADNGWGWYTLDPDKVKAGEAERLANRKKVVEMMERVISVSKNDELKARAQVVADRNQ